MERGTASGQPILQLRVCYATSARRFGADCPFDIRGREYGVFRDGGLHFSTDTRAASIGDLQLRLGERFTL